MSNWRDIRRVRNAVVSSVFVTVRDKESHLMRLPITRHLLIESNNLLQITLYK